jgi:hypothetical protein
VRFGGTRIVWHRALKPAAAALFSSSVVRDDPNRPSEGEDFFDDLAAFSPLVEVGFEVGSEAGCCNGNH